MRGRNHSSGQVERLFRSHGNLLELGAGSAPRTTRGEMQQSAPGSLVAIDLPRLLCVFETAWDRKQLGLCRDAWEGRVELVFAEPTDADCPAEFDALGLIERAVAGELGRIDGVFSASDYPGATVAAAIATRLGLAGSRP